MAFRSVFLRRFLSTSAFASQSPAAASTAPVPSTSLFVSGTLWSFAFDTWDFNMQGLKFQFHICVMGWCLCFFWITVWCGRLCWVIQSAYGTIPTSHILKLFISGLCRKVRLTPSIFVALAYAILGGKQRYGINCRIRDLKCVELIAQRMDLWGFSPLIFFFFGWALLECQVIEHKS